MMAYPFNDALIMLALRSITRASRAISRRTGQSGFRSAATVLVGGAACTRTRHRLVGMGDQPSTLNDRGLPLDYHDGSLKYLGQLRLDFYKNLVDRVLARDPYAAMLMAMHGVALMNSGYGPMEMPKGRFVSTEDFPSPYNPLGAKGAGAGGITAAGAALANAVSNALGAEVTGCR
jgi:hypothetical protein